MAQATTELVAQLDVDMLISNQMSRWLEHGNNSAEIVKVRGARHPTRCKPTPHLLKRSTTLRHLRRRCGDQPAPWSQAREGEFAGWGACALSLLGRPQACRQRNVFVLPAFETHGKNTSHSAILSDKLAMQSKRKLVRGPLRRRTRPWASGGPLLLRWLD